MPLDLGHNGITSSVVVGVAAVVRLGGSGRNEEGRSNGIGLHFE